MASSLFFSTLSKVFFLPRNRGVEGRRGLRRVIFNNIQLDRNIGGSGSVDTILFSQNELKRSQRFLTVEERDSLYTGTVPK